MRPSCHHCDRRNAHSCRNITAIASSVRHLLPLATLCGYDKMIDKSGAARKKLLSSLGFTSLWGPLRAAERPCDPLLASAFFARCCCLCLPLLVAASLYSALLAVPSLYLTLLAVCDRCFAMRCFALLLIVSPFLGLSIPLIL